MNRRERHDRRTQMLLRYKKQRQRNLLAEPGCHDFVLVLDNLKAGYNVPKIFRSAQAFGAHAVHLINIGPFDPAPGKGAFKQVPAFFHETFDECYQLLDKEHYKLFTLEPESGQEINESALPEKSVFIFGHEEQGISFELTDYPDIEQLKIPQYGSIQSLNVSVAASIVMYEQVRQHSRSLS